VAADAGFYSAKNEAAAKAKASSASASQPLPRALSGKRDKEAWFRNGQKWRTGCEVASAWSNDGMDWVAAVQGDTGNQALVGLG